MRVRTLLWLAVPVVLAVIAWWCSPLWPRSSHAAVAMAPPAANAAAFTSAAACRLPPQVADGQPPLQGPAEDGPAAVRVADATLRPLAGFSLAARVLGRQDYRSDREARYAPTDLALGWGRMAEAAVLSRLEIRQSARWYRYRWRDQPPLPEDEMVRSSANMHLIPADARIAADLARLRRDDRVRIDGWLVEVNADDGWRWRSSLTRDDRGSGACEVVYVCAVSRE